MKRAILAVLLIVCVILLVGCGEQALKKGSFEDIYADMTNTGALPPMLMVDADTALDFYGVAPADYTQSLLFIAEDSLRANEVLFFRAADEGAAQRIEELLNARMAAKASEAKNYSPEQYAVIQKGRVITNGLTLALIVSPEIDKLVTIYSSYTAD